MFYIEVPETYPRSYQLVAELPPVPVGKRWRGYAFAQVDNAFVVHTRLHGTHDKPQPYALRGVDKSGRLLVTALVETEYDKIGSWHEVDAEYTTEGYRFKRYTLKPLATLIKLATTHARVRVQVEKKQAKLANRAEKCGTCPVCFGDYVVYGKSPRMVHHGYERPGIGYIVGDCHGVDFPPFEVSCEGTKSFHERLGGRLVHVQGLLATVDGRDEVSVQIGTKFINGHRLPNYKAIKRGEDGFFAAIANLRSSHESEIRGLERTLVEYAKHIADWAPKQFPRVMKKRKSKVS